MNTDMNMEGDSPMNLVDWPAAYAGAQDKMYWYKRQQRLVKEELAAIKLEVYTRLSVSEICDCPGCHSEENDVLINMFNDIESKLLPYSA